ncbi:Uncharacterized protein dnm_002800 [Desulfonema magnum]|uniref:Uncharacterized protein n=1 Tax=Desulfonema magnum TaxID=45655 RepID=A0A975BF44_9BACT|nr:Uncharacterized protein dnm_002800 [Desulfonema magnum]
MTEHLANQNASAVNTYPKDHRSYDEKKSTYSLTRGGSCPTVIVRNVSLGTAIGTMILALDKDRVSDR